MANPPDTHLVIGDTHAKSGEDLSRFSWLGKAIMDLRPTKVICLGDFNDMGSLSSYDKGKKSFYNASIEADILTSHMALGMIREPLEAYWKRSKKSLNIMHNKGKPLVYKPEFIMLGGNHDEARIERTIQSNPELTGLISIEKLGYAKFGWKYIPYTVPCIVDGIAYCHHFASGIMGKPIGGKYLASSLIATNLQSSTVGHDHSFQYASKPRADGTLVHGLSAGCYTEDEPPYANGAHKFWWRGLIYKTNVKNGDYSLKQFTMDEVKANWS